MFSCEPIFPVPKVVAAVLVDPDGDAAECAFAAKGMLDRDSCEGPCLSKALPTARETQALVQQSLAVP